MTSNQAKIVLTNPCSENWDSMQVDPVGRFCQSCQKSVIDFSSKSDDEIKAFLKDKKGKKLCGRFYVHQVERIRIEIDPNLLISNIPSWQKFLVVFLVCFGQDFLGVDFTFAQTETDSIPVKTEQINSLTPIPVVEPDSTLEARIDSVKERGVFKKKDREVVNYISMLAISGDFILVNERYHDPESDFSFVPNQAKKDTVDREIAIVQTSKNNPIPPKSPQKKSSPPENAVIADSGDRRKTRRS